jgi:hypothetical protein
MDEKKWPPWKVALLLIAVTSLSWISIAALVALMLWIFGGC